MSTTLSLKSFACKALFSPITSKAIGLVFGNRIPNIRPVNGKYFKYDLNNPYIQEKKKSLVFLGSYERAESRLIFNYIRKDLDVIELGASIGIISSQIRNIVNKEKQFICVEANPYLFPSIKTNIQINNPDKSFLVENYAVAYGADAIEFDINSDPGVSRISSTQGADLRSKVKEVVTVPAITLSDLLSKNNYREFAMVCDIEGAEIYFLKQDAQALQNCKQLIIELHRVEYGGRKYSVKELVELICSMNFTLKANVEDAYVFERS